MSVSQEIVIGILCRLTQISVTIKLQNTKQKIDFGSIINLIMCICDLALIQICEINRRSGYLNIVSNYA